MYGLSAIILPSPPPPEGLHPLIVHMPIGLLLVIPFLILGGLLAKRCNMAWWGAALVILLLGTIAAWVAVQTGGMSIKGGVVATATAMNPDNADAIMKLVGEHADAAKDVRNIFTGITILFAAFLATVTFRKQELKKSVLWGVAAIFMVLWLFGAYKLTLAGHMGATLVHKYQVTVPVEATPDAKP
ncbi:MAG: DUF2231 domain-containing protein [Armatimonadota bacterium]